MPKQPSYVDSKPLRGQKALVTGASSGIGRAIAIAVARAGADVAVNYASGADKAKEVVAEIEKEGGRAFAVGADVSQEDQVLAMFRDTLERFGTLDILVNNAGLQNDAPCDQMTLAQWNRVIGVN